MSFEPLSDRLWFIRFGILSFSLPHISPSNVSRTYYMKQTFFLAFSISAFLSVFLALLYVQLSI